MKKVNWLPVLLVVLILSACGNKVYVRKDDSVDISKIKNVFVGACQQG